MPPIGAALAAIGAAAAAAPLAALTLGVTAAGTAASISQGNKSAKQAKNAASDAAQKQDSLEREVVSRRAGAESEANAINVRDQARRRQAGLAVGAGGRQDTILTGPLGVGGEVAGKKTLLGT